jgi:hypothetical protein
VCEVARVSCGKGKGGVRGREQVERTSMTELHGGRFAGCTQPHEAAPAGGLETVVVRKGLCQ